MHRLHKWLLCLLLPSTACGTSSLPETRGSTVGWRDASAGLDGSPRRDGGISDGSPGPDGAQPSRPLPDAAVLPPCPERDQSNCEADERCVAINGGEVDSENGCILDSKFAGCTSEDHLCEDTLSCGVSPDNKPWQFADSCMPDTFTPLPLGAPECQLPQCNPTVGPTT